VFLDQEPLKLKVRDFGRIVADCEQIADMYMFTVLPPIPTTGVSIDDVSALANRVRDQMLTTLREISVTVPSSKMDKSPVTENPPDAALADPGTTTTSIPSEPAFRVETPTQTAAVPTPTEMETASTTSSQVLKKDGSENGTETEEDEGMVLVGHPK